MTDKAPEPAFGEPWHAQLFALTVHLNECGRFTWSDWVGSFSKTLAKHGVAQELDGGNDYFHAWLQTLETLLADDGVAERGEVDTLRDAWEHAYLNTPHGNPVRLSPAPS